MTTLQKVRQAMISHKTYDDDLNAALALAGQFVDLDSADGQMRKWIGDALNNEWRDGLTIEQWVAQAIERTRHGV